MTLGLRKGGSCHGKVYSLHSENEIEELKKVFYRESGADIYYPLWLKVSLPHHNEEVIAVAFVANEDSSRFVGNIPFEEKVTYAANGVGSLGPAYEYIFNTIDTMKEKGIEDQLLMTYREGINDFLQTKQQ